MTSRADAKRRSRRRIVDAAADKFRRQGAGGAGVAEIMTAAGLTHGAFYSHFQDKDELVAEALAHAVRRHENWMDGEDAAPERRRAASLARRYLNPVHRDRPELGCPYPPLLAELSRDPATGAALSAELSRTLARLGERFADGAALSAADKATGLFAACVGGLLLARGLEGDARDRVLESTRRFIEAAFRDAGES